MSVSKICLDEWVKNLILLVLSFWRKKYEKHMKCINMKSYLHLLHQNLIIIVRIFLCRAMLFLWLLILPSTLHFNCPILPVTSVVILLLSFYIDTLRCHLYLYTCLVHLYLYTCLVLPSTYIITSFFFLRFPKNTQNILNIKCYLIYCRTWLCN